MTKLLPTLIFGFLWAWLTERTTIGKYGVTNRQTSQNRFFFAMLVITLALPIMLRKTYNDTGAYISNFQDSDTLMELFNSGDLQILRNPAFTVYNSLIRTFTSNYMVLFMGPAFFVQYSYMRFIRRHCPDLIIGVALYFCLGTYTFAIAAMKQTIAMAILLFSVDFLIDRKYVYFYLTVFLAVLFHTYAICFLVLPLFTERPWTVRTFLLMFAVFFVMRNFESVLTSFLEVADESGKHISETEILGTASINPIRVAVYAVVPIMTLLLRRQLCFDGYDREHSILVNMSIISVLIMSIGLVSAANMFARMAQYFEFGLICSVLWIIKKPFSERSAQFVTFVALGCFIAFFLYSNLIWMPFDDHFARYTVLEFIRSLFVA